MIVIISPAKTIDFSLPFHTTQSSKPGLEKEANQLASKLKAYTTKDIKALMGISDALALLNYERFQSWNSRQTEKKQALGIFKGEVYNGMEAWTWKEEDLLYAQDHLRILSGMYGILRPLDAIKAYRLEMGTKLPDQSLYAFWDNKLTAHLNRLASKSGKTLVNLASKEYSKAVQLKDFKGTVITPDFKEMHQGKYKTIAIYAKKARGLMARYILENKIEEAEELKAFDLEGYHFNPQLSTKENFIFTRG